MGAMNTLEKFKKDIADLLKARFPYIYISSFEESRVVDIIHDVVKQEELIKTPRTLFSWTLTEGILNEEGVSVGKDTKSPIEALEYIANMQEAAVFILKDFHIYFSTPSRSNDAEVIRKVRDLVIVLKKSIKPKNIIFLSPISSLPIELQKEITFLDFSLPTQDEIRYLLDEMIEKNGKRIDVSIDEEGKNKLVKAALGLTMQEAENAFARAMVMDGKLNLDDVEVVLEEKRQVIKKTGILEFIKSDLDITDVGGLQNLKRWLMKRDKSWSDDAKKYCLPAPKGVLVTGVPGCGKSLIAKSISAMWHLPLLRLDIGKIFSGVVGSSEENMRRAINTAEAVAPSILWIDEIEKGFSGTGSSGDSGTSTRIFGTFLTWMQEKINPVFVIATANNISSLPGELLRKGRFDEIFFVDLPTKNERMDIFKLHINKRLKNPDAIGDFTLTEDILNELADTTEGFVGAEIEQVVISSLFESFYENRAITIDDFRKTIKNTVPLSVTQREQISAIREWASVRAVAATPSEDRQGYQKYEKEISTPAVPDPGSDQKRDISDLRGGRAVDF